MTDIGQALETGVIKQGVLAEDKGAEKLLSPRSRTRGAAGEFLGLSFQFLSSCPSVPLYHVSF